MNIILLSIVVIFSYTLIQAIEITSFGSRVAGRISNRNALGTTISQTVYTFSRFFVVLFLPSLAYVIESGISINEYLIIVLLAYSFSFITSALMLLKLNSIQHFFQIIFLKYNKNSLPIAFLKAFHDKKEELNLSNCNFFSFNKLVTKKTFVSFLAYIFLITGFFNAFMLAVLFPENRLTLSQTTTIFHGFGALIFAFYIDPMLSRSIDSFSDDVSWLKNVYSILVGRALSYLVMIIVTSFFYFVFY